MKDTLCKRLRVISAYFPDSTYGDAAYQSMQDAMDELERDAREKGMQVLVGCDLNADLGDDVTAEGILAWAIMDLAYRAQKANGLRCGLQRIICLP